MKTKKFILVASLLAGGVCLGGVKAEEIMLQDLYGISPLDNSKTDWKEPTLPPGRIVAQINNGIVKVDFKKPAGNANVIISKGDGSVFRQHSELNPQNISIDMSGAEAGEYMLEVYTDTEALGGAFEVK